MPGSARTRVEQLCGRTRGRAPRRTPFCLTSSSIAVTWLGVEAGIGASRRFDAARRQAGADEKQQRDRDLRDHELGAQPSARGAAWRGVFVDHRHQVDPRAVQRRNESEHERAPAGDERRETDHEAVDVDIEEDPLRCGEPLGVADQDRDSALREQHAEHGAGHGEHEVLDDQQPDDTRPRSRRAPDARAISPRRDRPRTSTSPAMFAHAIISTSSPIGLSTPSVGRMNVGPLLGDCQNGTTLSRCAASVERPFTRERGPQRIGLRGGARERRARPEIAVRKEDAGAAVGENPGRRRSAGCRT